MSFILLYGKPGTGKTTLAASMTKLGHKVLFLDLDQKVKSMVNLSSLLDSGDIQVTTIDAKLTEVNLKQRITTPKIALTKRPKGYLEFCDIISDLEKMIEDGVTHECQVLVVDSLTSLIEHLNRLISSIQNREKFTFDEWAIVLTNLEEIFYTLMRLQKLFNHVIITAHEQSEVVKDKESGAILKVLDVLPAIQGSMRFKAAKFFEEVYYTYVESSKTAPLKFLVSTKPVNKCHARTSRNLEVTETADFLNLFREGK